MSSDIQPGDLVVCVDVPDWPFSPAGIGVGRTYRVAETFLGMNARYERAMGLTLVGFDHSPMHGIQASHFRKLNDEPDNAELVERIRKCRPIKVGVDA